MDHRIHALNLFVGFLILYGLVSPTHGSTVEDLLAKLNKLPPRERQKRLEEGAKREGSLKFYSISNAVLLRSYTKAFMKRYPFVKAEYWRGSGSKLVFRTEIEHRTGNLSADVISVRTEHATSIIKSGIWGRYRSPETRFYPKEFYDENGYWHAGHLGLATMAYNHSLVKPEEVPKGYEDLLDPKWKGNMSIDTEPGRALAGWLVAWGEERTRKFLRKLLQNGALLRRGHTLQAQLMCAGEFKIAVEIYPDAVARLRRNGCPATIVFPDPTPGTAGGIMGIYPNSPHPHAAALFVDFILSEEGAKILARTGRLSTRKGIKPKFEELANLEKKGVNLVIVSPKQAGELIKPMERILKEILLQ